jgi:hypothetical protein
MFFMSRQPGLVRIDSCGKYYPPKVQKEIGRDQISGYMMDFKNPTCNGHQRSIPFFGNLLINKVEMYHRQVRTGYLPLLAGPIQVAIVPSHTKGKVSDALMKIAGMLADKYPNVMTRPLLTRIVDVPSSHKDNGSRQISHHMATIRVVTDNLLPNIPVLLIDDVKTTGGSMSACYHLLEQAGAGEIYPIALLETSYA